MMPSPCVQEPAPWSNSQFQRAVSAVYPNGTLRPNINPGATGTPGQGDARVQAYNFRLCMTADANNRVPLGGAPDGYNATNFDLLARYIATDPSPTVEHYLGFNQLPGNKVSFVEGSLDPPRLVDPSLLMIDDVCHFLTGSRLCLLLFSLVLTDIRFFLCVCL